MADKSSILKAFNKHFFEFFEEMSKIFPDNLEINSAVTLFEITKKANPTMIIKIWNKFVEIPYGNLLNEGNINYFINKDYSEDVKEMPNAENVIRGINAIRNPIKEMSDENKNHSLNYLQNLCKLSKVYSSL
jgi:hypothetical protein